MRGSLLIATGNQGKVKELRQLLSSLEVSLHSLEDFPRVTTVEEAGTTFEQNAELKAAGYASQSRMLTLADDSGLEVAALDGAPGVRSARYGSEHATDSQRTKKLLAELAGQTNRTARFVSVIAIADSDGTILNQSLGTCEGRIALEPRGCQGFGYDPIFIPDGYELTFAELEPNVKNEISHRARALQQTREYLFTLFRSSAEEGSR